MAVKIVKSVGTATLVFGIIQVIVGAIIAICCFVYSTKITGGSKLASYWTAIPVWYFIDVRFHHTIFLY